MDLTAKMMDNWDVLAEFNPPEALQQMSIYTSQDFSTRDWNRIQYFKGKALAAMYNNQEAEEIALECIRASINEEDFYILVKCHILQAVTYYGTEAEEQIKPLLNMALEYAMESGDYTLMIPAHCAYMYYLSYNSLIDLALKQEGRIVDLINRVPASYTTVSALQSLALLYVKLSDWEIAIRYFTQALEQAQPLALDFSQLNILNNLGSALSRVRDYIRAEKILKQGLSLAQNMGIRHKVFLFTSNLGNIRIEEARYLEAIEYYDKCMKLLENVPNKPPMLLIDLYNNYSLCFWKLKKYDTSLEYVDKAIDIASNSNSESDLVQIEVNKTNLLEEMGKYEEALVIIKRAVKYYTKTKDLHQLMWVYRSMSKIYFRMKEYKKSYQAERKRDEIINEYISSIQRKEVEKDITSIKVSNTPAEDIHTFGFKSEKSDSAHGFVGCSKAYHQVINSAMLAAKHQNTSVLILGESGTGKEIIAQLIHKNSLRRDQAFVPVNVGALTSSLVESELFGHTKGAFTGAESHTKGFFLQADKGTIFLDEITDMPFAVQSKLLRALETRKVTAVGSSKETPFNSRVISATSQDIRSQLSDSQFRLDLFHRLNTIEIIIPPLRERQEDIEPIWAYYLKKFATELNKGIPYIDRSLLDMLYSYDFPGNVRELKNIVERMYILSKKNQWDAQLLCEINPFSFASDNLNRQQDYDEEDAIVKALIKAKGKQKEAAIILNISESTLCRRIVKYKLQQHTRKNG